MYAEEKKIKNNPRRVYFQAKSEIEYLTTKNNSFSVYYFEENCKKDFPESEIVPLSYGTIECPEFKDLSLLNVEEWVMVMLSQLLPDKTYLSWKDTDNISGEAQFNDKFGFTIFESRSDLPTFSALWSYVFSSGIDRDKNTVEEVHRFITFFLNAEGPTVLTLSDF